MYSIQTKRIYEPAEPDDGARFLVDRLWPRGISKIRAQLEGWPKTIAPQNGDRKALHDGKETFDEFSVQYRKELDSLPDAEDFADTVAALLKDRNVTLLYGSKDQQHNNARVLKDWLEEKIAENSGRK